MRSIAFPGAGFLAAPQEALLRNLVAPALLRVGRLGLALPFGAAGSALVLSRFVTGAFSVPLSVAVFLCVYASYLIDHLAEVNEFDGPVASGRSQALRHRRLFGLLGAASFAGSIGVTLACGRPAAALILCSFPLAVAGYCLPLTGGLTGGRYRRLKDIPGIKSVYTAFFWGCLGSFGVVFLGGGSVSQHVFFAGLLFLAMYVNTVLCDFKDLDRDRISGTRTLPLMLGTTRTLRLLHATNAVSMAWIAGFAMLGVVPPAAFGLVAARGLVEGMLRYCGRPGADLRFIGEAVADLEMAFWLPAVVIANHALAVLG